MIYIVKHMPCPTYMADGYKEMMVGQNETLSYLNPYINEVTGLYEIWKKEDPYKGLVHYRRLFSDGSILAYERAKEILNDYDVITTMDFEPPTPLQHLISNLDKDLVEKYIYQLPKEVTEWFESYHPFNICSMFVSKKEFIDAYCEWLFPLIIPLAEQFVREDVTDNVKRNRTVGFIIECLFGYWCKDFNRYKMGVRRI